MMPNNKLTTNRIHSIYKTTLLNISILFVYFGINSLVLSSVFAMRSTRLYFCYTFDDFPPLFSAGGHFFGRNSGSPRSVVCEMELPDIQMSLDMYDENKSWGHASCWPLTPVPLPPHPWMRGQTCFPATVKATRLRGSRTFGTLVLQRVCFIVRCDWTRFMFVTWKLSLAPWWSFGWTIVTGGWPSTLWGTIYWLILKLQFGSQTLRFCSSVLTGPLAARTASVQ